MKNDGNLLIPEGTKVNWDFNTLQTSQIEIQFSDSTTTPINQVSENNYQGQKKFTNDLSYQIKFQNKKVIDSMKYTVRCIKDAYPTIEVQTFKDSIFKKKFSFESEIDKSLVHEANLMLKSCAGNEKDAELIHDLLELQRAKVLLMNNRGLQKDLEKSLEEHTVFSRTESCR